MIVALVTDRRRLAPSASEENRMACLVQQARYASEAGVDLIQVREPDLPAGQLATAVAAIVAVTQGSSTRVVVNDRLDVAVAAGADGVHLKGDSFDCLPVRRVMGSSFVIGRSIHRVEEAMSVTDADYFIAGTVWPTTSKTAEQPLLGIDGLSRIVAASRVPVLAIGGVTAERVREIASTGAAGIAAIGLFIAGEGSSMCCAMRLSDLLDEMRATFDTSGSGS
jgi:thiamine-phosphate diphosphorylase